MAAPQDKKQTSTISDDAAFVWLRFCQRFKLERSDARAARARELVIARKFLQLGRSRRNDLRSLSPACLLRVSEAYAKASHSASTSTGRYHTGSDYWGRLVQAGSDGSMSEDSSRSLDSRLDVPFKFFHDSVPLEQEFD